MKNWMDKDCNLFPMTLDVWTVFRHHMTAGHQAAGKLEQLKKQKNWTLRGTQEGAKLSVANGNVPNCYTWFGALLCSPYVSTDILQSEVLQHWD